MNFKLYGLVLVVALLLVYSAEAAVIKITQSKAQTGNVTTGDTPGFPITISTKGSFQLDGNLTVPANKHGFEITADNVTLDLNGFTIEGLVGSGFGVYGGDANKVTIHNGKITNMGSTGIHLGTNSRVEKMIVTQNGGIAAVAVSEGSSVVDSIVSNNINNGINTGNNVIVSGNTVIHNGGSGISVGTGIVSGNTASDNHFHGIYVYYSGLVVGNAIIGNDDVGLVLANSTSAGYRENVIDGNIGTVSGGRNMGNNVCNGNLSCP